MKKNIEDILNDNKEHGKLSLIFVIMLLVIIIILLLWNFSRASLNTNQKPTGNVDVFDLECTHTNNTICNTNQTPNVDKNDDNIDKKPDEIINVPEDKKDDKKEDDIKENPIDETVPGFNIFDKNIKWEVSSSLRIFEHAAYNFASIIAPGTSNSYVFRIRNNNDFKVIYSINFAETNDYNINMKYKLLHKGNYLVGSSDSWANYDELSVENKILDKYTYDEYTLEWKWVESENDTQIGSTDGASYNLNIEILGVEYEE